ncbi:hypothetical protein HN51_048206, partial [Arachis hypogaea]
MDDAAAPNHLALLDSCIQPYPVRESCLDVKYIEDKKIQLLLNAGGPDKVSRVQMAKAVAQFKGHDTSKIKPVSASL